MERLLVNVRLLNVLQALFWVLLVATLVELTLNP